jgi:hypothetical protein
MKMKLSNIAIMTATFCMMTFASADEVILPVISKPALLEEGTQRTLTQAQINELLPWAKTSKLDLVDLLEDIKDMSMKDKIDHLTKGINGVVADSRPTSELFMRYILNRALVLQETLKKETDENAVGINDAKLRILLSSVKMALKYHDVDTKMLNNNSSMTFASFGANYFFFLQDLNKSIFDASAQFEFNKITLEWLSWDLYRDLENKSYASQIVKIHKFLKDLPSEKGRDTQALIHVRKMRDLQEKLNISALIKQITDKSPARELKVGERILVKNSATGFLRDAIVYANVSADVPNHDPENNNSHYCVKFTNPNEGESFMAYENFVKRSEILLASGCGDKFCVGQEVVELKSRDRFTVAGVTVNGDYAIRAPGKREMLGMQDRELGKVR